jgi:hypothetical protein
METLGTVNKRVIPREESYNIVIGFPINSAKIATDYAPNMLVKMANDGSVLPITATTDQYFGRVTSNWQPTDKGVVRIAIPCEAHMFCTANGTLDEGQLVACSGWDATNLRPIFKAAVSGDWAAGIVFIGGATTTECQVGILRTPIKVA